MSRRPLARATALETIGEIELERHDLVPAIEHLKAGYFEWRALSDQEQTYRISLMITQVVAANGKLDEANEWLEHARAEAERLGVPLRDSTFYTDSYSDLTVMEAVSEPVAVNPDPRLRRYALKRGWLIVDWGEATARAA